MIKILSDQPQSNLVELFLEFVGQHLHLNLRGTIY